MDQHASDAFWISKLVNSKRASAPKKKYDTEPSLIGTPTIGLESGIRTGWISYDLQTFCREDEVEEEMARAGYDPNIGFMDQMRFDRPHFYKAFKDMMAVAKSTGETTCCTIIDDHTVSQPVFVKVTPTEDGWSWVCVRVTELLAATLKDNEHLVEEIQNHAIRSVG